MFYHAFNPSLSAGAAAALAANTGAIQLVRRNIYLVECFDKRTRKLKWKDTIHNLVVNEGLQDSLNKHFKASGYTAAWYVGLTDGTPTVAAADDMTTHAGWTEITAYDEAVRQTLTLGTPTDADPSVVDNSASRAVFTISGTTTVGGAFVTTVNTKGGTTGILYGAGAFTEGDKAVDDNDVLNVTITLQADAP